MPAAVQWEWRILDCEEDEWAQIVQGASIGQPQPPATDLGTEQPGTANLSPTPRSANRLRGWLTGGLLLAALVGSISWRLWQDAQRGAALIRQDIANVVKLETVKAGLDSPAAADHAQVRTVDFRGDEAMVQVVVTRTAACGTVVVQRQTRFYTRGPQGWARTSPVALFWGDVVALDTSHLHFLYRELDSAAVEDIAQDAELMTVTLDRLFGAPTLAPATKITVEVVPLLLSRLNEGGVDRIVLSSPLLHFATPERTATQLLAWQLRHRLVSRAVENALARRPVQPQWTFMAEAIRSWLTWSEALPLSQGVKEPWLPPKRITVGNIGRLPYPRGQLLRQTPGGVEAVADGKESYLLDEGESLVDYLAQRYGMAGLAALYAGLGRYRDWEELAPAVFDTSAEQLRIEWQASLSDASPD